MPTVRWNGGAGTGVVSTAANWEGGAVPAVDDIAIIASTDYDLSGTFTNKPAELHITGGWRGRNIGSVGTALAIAAVAGTVTLIKITGTDALELCHISAGSSNTLTLATIDDPGNGPVVFSGGGTISTLRHGTRGTVVIETNVTLTNAKIGGRAVLVCKPIGTATGIVTLKVDPAAKAILERALVATTGRADINGLLQFQGAPTAGLSMGANSLIVVNNGGTLQYAAKPPTSGNTFAEVSIGAGGRFTPQGAYESFTVDILESYRGAIIEERAGSVEVTFTTRRPIGIPVGFTAAPAGAPVV